MSSGFKKYIVHSHKDGSRIECETLSEAHTVASDLASRTTSECTLAGVPYAENFLPVRLATYHPSLFMEVTG